ncbi:hypothetical protein B0H13DRAFT_1870428 [Mycena leptocephala]|nr:hypothetical protein B0H13DRAFT_1870428 [Mycena leptocephala]
MGFCSSGRDRNLRRLDADPRERGVPTVPAGVSRSQIIAKPNTEPAEITDRGAEYSASRMLELESGNWGKEKKRVNVAVLGWGRAWTNPPLQALPRRREGSGGGLEWQRQLWSYLTASDTLNEAVTLGRVWMLMIEPSSASMGGTGRLVTVLTGRPLLFKGSMGVPEAPHLSKDDHARIQGFVHLESPQVVEDFKVWIANIPDPDGAITSLCHFYFASMLTVETKQLHSGSFRKISCLSRIPLNDWYTCLQQPTWVRRSTHATQRLVPQMGIIESFKKYAEYDARRAAEINIKLATGNLNNNQNELVHRYASSNRRHAAATDKVKFFWPSTCQASSEGEKAETNTQGKASAVRRSSSRVASRDVEVEREDIQEDEHEGMQGTKEDEVLQLGKETSGQQISDTYALVTPENPQFREAR